MKSEIITPDGGYVGPIKVVVNAITYESRNARRANRKIEKILAQYDCLMGIYHADGELPELLIFPADFLKRSKTEKEILTESIGLALEA